MPLINAAITCHSPILIPEIGKMNQKILQKTTDAYNKIAQELLENEIETLIIISPHGQIQDNLFTINAGPELIIDLSNFGFFANNKKFFSDLDLINLIKKSYGTEIQLGGGNLDHGTSIPTHLLNQGKKMKLVSINCAKDLNLEEHWNLGLRLKNIINSYPKKVAIIASGDLSHRLKKESPSGYSPKGAKFDNKLIDILINSSNKKNDILSIDPKLIQDAAECGLKPITVLLGSLSDTQYEAQNLAYQTELGIGYLTMNFKF